MYSIYSIFIYLLIVSKCIRLCWNVIFFLPSPLEGRWGMRATQASIHRSERDSVSLNQSGRGGGLSSNTKLALLAAKNPPPQLPPPFCCTHKTSQCREMLSSCSEEVVGGGGVREGADYTPGGADRLHRLRSWCL